MSEYHERGRQETCRFNNISRHIEISQQFSQSCYKNMRLFIVRLL